MPKRRESPLKKAATLDSVLDRAHRRYAGKEELTKLTVAIPTRLHGRLKQKAFDFTQHRRRGMQDLTAILIEYGLEAIENGDLEIELAARTVEVRITRAGG